MSATWNADGGLGGHDGQDRFAAAHSRLIDELRDARYTVAAMVAVATNPGDACFAVGLEAGIAQLLEDLGCCDGPPPVLSSRSDSSLKVTTEATWPRGTG